MDKGRAKGIKIEDKNSERDEVQVSVGRKAKATISVPKKNATRGKSDNGRGGNAKKQSSGAGKKAQNKSKRQKAIAKKNKAIAKKKVAYGKKRSKKTLKLIIFLIALLVVGGAVFVAWLLGPIKETEIKFSKETGLYQEEIEVELEVNAPTVSPIVTIKYTTNGDNPAVSGSEYTGPIRLKMGKAPRVYPIKAAYCYAGGKCSKPILKTYVLSTDPEENMTLEIISLTTDFKNLYDYETGIFVKGKTYDENKAKAEPGEYIMGNYNNRSDDWIRDSEVMRINSDGEVLWDQKVGMQTSGNTSAAALVKSVKLVANKKYGYTKLAYSFDDSGNSTKDLAVPKKYNSLKLRAGGQDMATGNIRSAVASRLAEQSDFDGYSATERAVVYMNGSFYSIVDVQQNFSDSFLKDRFGLADSDSIRKEKGKELETFDKAGITELFGADLNNKESRKRLETAVDMDDYLRYYALNILWNNTDWPQNNYEIWQYTGPETESKYSDGRWRFLLKDLDIIWYTKGNVLFFEGGIGDQLQALMESKYQATDSSFRKVIEVDYYREKFLKIIEELMDGPFQVENVFEVIEQEKEKIAPAMKTYYSERYYKEWQGWIELMKQAVKEHRQRLEEDLLEYFGLEI